ncbi:MAG: hypothetical protein Q9227_006393 [Pyrenula ochraceoflavens]
MASTDRYDAIHDPNTPPPPPPKPGSQDQSQIGTPSQNGPPVHPPPLSQGPVPTRQSGLSHFPGAAGSAENSRSSLLQLPGLEEGWLPSNVQDKSVSDLQAALSDSTLVDALACEHPAYAESLNPLEKALASNIVQVQQVQSTERHLTKLREDVQALLLQHTTLSAQWRRKQGDMDAALEPWSPKSMYQRLVAGITEQGSLVRAVEESFLEADHNIETGLEKATEKEVSDWVRRIREGTVLLEKRREARARWDEGRVGGWR